jgi:hypothetical protein
LPFGNQKSLEKLRAGKFIPYKENNRDVTCPLPIFF